jgi:ribonucleoside-diphosphate reductase alpha chain
MLDNVIDVSKFPLDAQRHEAEAKRRIGLGVTGLADALILGGLHYGSTEALAAVRKWMGAIRRHAYLASVALAAEKGAFPLYDRDAYLAGETVSGLDTDIRDAIARDGIRNALVTSIAPTGTISLLAGNISSGIEPVFRNDFTRDVLLPDGRHEQRRVMDYAADLYRRAQGADAALPDTFVDVATLSPEAHLATQAAVQEFVDSSISKTINLPEAISFEDFKDVYHRAYALGCKGCTTYRPNPVTGAVLAAEPVRTGGTERSDGVVYMTDPLERPESLQGRTYKLVWPDSDHAIYITVNDIADGSRRRPFEVFINSKNMEHYAWTVALTRMISAVFRRGGDVSFVVEELKAVFDPRGGQWMDGKYVPSLLAAIGEVIERHMIDIGFLPAPEARGDGLRESFLRQAVGGERLRQCPKCGAAGLTRQEGCDVCIACGYSKCV